MKNLSRTLSATILLLALIQCGCNSASSQGIQQAAPDIDKFIQLVRPVTGGYEVTGFNGTVSRTVSVGSRSWVSSLTPDLSGFYFVTIGKANEAQALKVSLSGFPSRTVYTGIWTKDNVPSLSWSATDGHAFFGLADGELSRWSACGTALNRTVISKGVAAFTFSSRTLYWIDTGSKNVLHWHDLLAGAKNEMHIPSGYDRLSLGQNEREVLLFSNSKSESGLSKSIAKVDTRNKQVSLLTVPVNGKIFDLVPIKDSASVVLEATYGNKERLDGTELTQFVIWNYAVGTVTRLVTNEKMFQLHETPDNIYSVPPECN